MVRHVVVVVLLAFSAALLGSPQKTNTQADSRNTVTQIENEPLRHICGVVVEPLGNPIPQAAVKLSRGTAELSAMRTGRSGKFSFRKAKPGTYWLQVQAFGFKTARYQITVARPTSNCTQPMRIKLPLADYSGPVVVVPPRQKWRAFCFEQHAKTVSSAVGKKY